MTAPARHAPVRCAIYTRKSSEEGLDQDFNSLDAQREACAAYVASQKHEGWILAPGRYDDGGVSGGTLERPALQRLLADIDAGAVQMIVVYKIDRLTRSLSDFARLIERLEAAGCSFVSVTQSFNTSTSMGRLTLNVLLSFAQFEREVTAERIRDKLAASKKKGMWMGGLVPLGYVKSDRALHVDPAEAETVRRVFDLYREHRSVAIVEEKLAALGLRTKRHDFADGRSRGGAPFSRGAIYHLLSNPLYIGMIRHRDQLHQGLHQAIIDRPLWDEVQAILAGNAARPKRRRRPGGRPRSVAALSPLAGRLSDETGDRLTPSHAGGSASRRRYYVSHRLLCARAPRQDGWRLPAPALEGAVAALAASALRAADAPARLLPDANAASLGTAAATLKEIAGAFAGDRRSETLASLVAAASIAPNTLTVRLDRAALAARLQLAPQRIAGPALILTGAFTLHRRGVETRILLAGSMPEPDPALLRVIAKGQGWWEAVRRGESLHALARREGVTQRRIAHLVNLAFLAPDIIEAIMDGAQPPGLTADVLVKTPLPLDWSEQRALLLSSRRA